MPRISADEYRNRLQCLQSEVAGAGLDLFLVSSFDNIYYLTGAGFESLERPFFLLVTPPGAGEPALLVPRLDAEHMKKALNAQIKKIHTYWDHPALEGRRWTDVLRNLTGKARRVGVEPSLRLDVAENLRDLSPVVMPLVEKLRLIKSPGEIAMIRTAAHYSDRAVQQLLASYHGATVAVGFARTGSITRSIIRENADWDPLTTRVLMATWAAPRSAQPHSISALWDRLREGPHVALAFLRVNGYAAENVIAFPTKQVQVNQVDAVELLRGFEERLARSLRFHTVTTGADGAGDAAAFQELHGFLRTSFPRVHARLDCEVHGGHSLLYRWKGSDPSREPILLMSHIDVVPIESGTETNWTHPPFSGDLSDGFIWGTSTASCPCASRPTT